MPVHICASSESVGHVWRRTFNDSEEQAACVQSLFPQRYHQVGAGPFAGEMTCIDFDGVVLVRERSNRRLIQEGSMNVLSIGWIPKQTGLFRCNGVDLDPQRIVLYGERAEFDIACDAAELIGVAIAPRTLAGLIQATPMPTARFSSGVRLMPAAIAAPLREAVSRALAMAERGDDRETRSREVLRRELIRLVLAIADLPDVGCRKRCDDTYARVVASAKRVLNSQLPYSMGIPDLCRRIGVSRRNLFYAFEAVLDTSPHQYLKTVRLDAVRRALKRQHADKRRIADLAWDAGFQNPSQFAADYKRRFGELPSDTTLRSAS